MKALLPIKLSPQLQRQLPRTLPWAIAALFAVLIGWQLLPLLSEPSSNVATISSANQASTDPRLQQIISSEIFGVMMEEESETTEAIAATDQTPQATSLPYVLKGIISAATPEQGSAIIELSPGDSRYFSAGREISSNITLDAVHSNHVIISNQGRKEILRLAELSLNMASVSANPSSSFGDSAPRNNMPRTASPAIPAPDLPGNATDNSQDREDLIKRDRIRQRLEELRARNPS